AYNATVQLRDGPVWLQTVSGCSRLIEVTNSLQQSSHDQMCSIRPARSKREWSATSTMPPQRGHFGRCERKRGLVWAAARNCANKIWYVGSVVIADVSSRRTPGSGPLWADARMLEWHDSDDCMKVLWRNGWLGGRSTATNAAALQLHGRSVGRRCL